MKNRGKVIAIILLVVVLILGAVAFYYGILRTQPTNTTQTTEVTPSAESPSPSASAPIPAECDTDPQPITNPVSMTLVNQQRDLPMVTVGTVEVDGGTAAGAPDGNEPYTVAWYSEGPEIGSSQGKVVLTSHTYQWGDAFGNQLIDGLLTPGDVIMISDDAGHHICYRYTEVLHVMVADYDPNSDIVYDYVGDPKFALVVCSDYTIQGETLGRMIYYGELIRG